MTITWIYITWFVLIFIEIWRNWYIIQVNKKRPVYWYSQLLRYVIGFLYWVGVGAISNGHTIAHEQWWGLSIMMLFTFWFFFDYGLNQFRNLMNRIRKAGVPTIQFDYLNPKGSWLDQMQYKFPGTFPWFCFKALLALTGITLFHYGIDIIWDQTAWWR